VITLDRVDERGKKMYWLFLLSALVIAYLAGSLNFAIIVSVLLGKADIRTMGNRNPGTANTARNLGKGWGAVVFLGDVGKVVVPLIVAEEIYFHSGTFTGTAGLMLITMAAILGHRKPIFFGFKGGGGLATTIGAFGFFGLAELLIAMLIGVTAGMMLFRNREFKLGRWIAMLIIFLTPLTHLVFALILETPVGGVLRFGGRYWPNVAAVAILAVYVFLSNIGTAVETIRSQKNNKASPPVDQSPDT
jgi:glycerol-3-phosphate acyltransferase PlsY